MTALVLLLAAALSAGNAEFDREANRLAADIAVARLKTELVEKGLATNLLERTMLEHPDRFRTRAESEEPCWTIYTNALDGLYHTRAAEIGRELNVTALPSALDAKTLDEAAGRHFAKDFAHQRAAACQAQARNIALKVKPDEADIESKGDDAARAWLTDRIAHARGMTVFEENLKYISEKIVDPVLADARRERKRQQEYLMRTRCDAYAPNTLAKGLEANLRKNVAERNAKCADPLKAWGVFPATLRTELPVAVERRLLGLVLKDIDEAPFAVDEETIRKTISADLAAHRTPAVSETIFRELLAKELAATALGKAVAAAPEAERAEFAAFVGEHAQSPDFVRAVEARVRRDALPKWRKVRTELAKSEAAKRWPTLADRTWYPDAELADRTAARSDYAQAVRDWRKAPELGTLAGPQTPTLEESDQDADRSVAAAFELARSAIAAQHAIVAEIQPNVLAAAKDPARGLFDRKPDLSAVIEVLTQKAETEWESRRTTVLWGTKVRPANADEQHATLFPSVRREIELVARQILEEVEKREKEEVEETEAKAKGEGEGQGQGAGKPEPPKPEDPEQPPEETPSDSSSDSQADEELCTISFKVSGGEVTVQAMRGKTTIAERKAKATARGFEDAVRQVGGIVGREIFKLK